MFICLFSHIIANSSSEAVLCALFQEEIWKAKSRRNGFPKT